MSGKNKPVDKEDAYKKLNRTTPHVQQMLDRYTKSKYMVEYNYGEGYNPIKALEQLITFMEDPKAPEEERLDLQKVGKTIAKMANAKELSAVKLNANKIFIDLKRTVDAFNTMANRKLPPENGDEGRKLLSGLHEEVVGKVSGTKHTGNSTQQVQPAENTG